MRHYQCERIGDNMNVSLRCQTNQFFSLCIMYYVCQLAHQRLSIRECMHPEEGRFATIIGETGDYCSMRVLKIDTFEDCRNTNIQGCYLMGRVAIENLPPLLGFQDYLQLQAGCNMILSNDALPEKAGTCTIDTRY